MFPLHGYLCKIVTNVKKHLNKYNVKSELHWTFSKWTGKVLCLPFCDVLFTHLLACSLVVQNLTYI